jgi:hypothetical protein
MNRAPKVAMLAAVIIAGVVVAAVAGAGPRGAAGATSCSHAAGAQRTTSGRALLEDEVVMSAPIEVDSAAPAPSPAPEAVDWSNPYDLMLHGIRPSKTHDMR